MRRVNAVLFALLMATMSLAGCFGGDDKLDLDNDGIPDYCDLVDEKATNESIHENREITENTAIIILGLIAISGLFFIRRFRA